MAAIYKNFELENSSRVEKLYHQSFTMCADSIKNMSTEEKATVASQVQPKLDYLYQQASTYDNDDYDACDRISPEVFVLVMSKIKRWETLLYWLYEIDILMEETQLDSLIREAEGRIAQAADPKNLTRARFIKDEFGRKSKVVVNCIEDLADLKEEKRLRGINTEEIMTEAARLTKLFGGNM